MRRTTSIMLGGIYSYELHVWEQGSTVYHTRTKGEVHCGKTMFYVLIPNDHDKHGLDMGEGLKEVIRTHGEKIAEEFVRVYPGKVGQLLIYPDKNKWVLTNEISQTGNLDLSSIITSL